MASQEASGERLRQAPVERFAGAEHTFDLAREVERLRAEPHPGKDGHRQIVLFRRDPVSLLLFAFDAGGGLSDHLAEGVVTIQVLSGSAEITTPDATHVLRAGHVLVLRPGVLHDLLAPEPTDVLVTIHLVQDAPAT